MPNERKLTKKNWQKMHFWCKCFSKNFCLRFEFKICGKVTFRLTESEKVNVTVNKNLVQSNPFGSI